MSRGRVKDQGGFTLVELIITVTIVAILARFAVVAYSSSVQKAARSDAKDALAKFQVTEERCYSQYFSYANSACPTAGTLGNSPNNYYSVALSNLSATTYTLTATPVAGTQAAKDAQCTSFKVDQTGAQTATGSATALYCWTGHN